MKYIALTVLLAVMQATPPAPRKPTHNHKAPTTEPSSPKSEHTQADDETSGKPDANSGQIVVFSEPPGIPVARKDEWDKAYVIFTGLLVVIGGFTLGAVWYQAKKTAEAADSMRRNTEAFI